MPIWPSRATSLPDTAGELVTTDGQVIGEHTGIHNFTVGQRKGLGVATGSPLYVIQINGDTAAGRGRQAGRAVLANPARAPRKSDLSRRSARADARAP